MNTFNLLIVVWTQNLTLGIEVATAAPQETRDPQQETRDTTPQILLARCSLAELSLAKPSLAKPSLAELSLAKLSLAELSHNQPTEYD